MRSLLAAVVLTTLAPAAPVPKAVKKVDDAGLLVGRWRPNDGSKQWYEFKADGTFKTWNEPSEDTAYHYKWSIDPTASPKRMTMSNAGSGKAEWEAVYELDGDDLRITYSGVGKVPAGIGKEFGIFNGLTRDTTTK